MMFPDMRIYKVVTEGNLCDQWFPYIKQQELNLSEEMLLHTKLNMSSIHHAATEADYVDITFDFSSWCTNFRHELATDVFNILNELFGVFSIFEFTHSLPMRCFLETDPHVNLEAKTCTKT